MRRKLLLSGIFALFLCLSSGAFGLDVPLKYEKAPSNPKVFSPSGHGYCSLSPIKPPGDWKIPPLRSKEPLYGLVKLGDSDHLLIMDSLNADDDKYSRMLIDCNGNGDLNDDPPIDGKIQERNNPGNNYYYIEYPSVDMKIKIDGALVSYCITPYFAAKLKRDDDSLGEPYGFSFSVYCTYTGTFKIDKSQYSIRLVDVNGNGRFNDPPKFMNNPNFTKHYGITPRGDVIFISNGNKVDYFDNQYLGDLLFIKDKLYDVKVDLAGGKMILTEVKKGLSKLKLPVTPEYFSIYTVDGGHFLTAYQPSGNIVNVPVGNYKLMGYQILRKDEQGDLWCIDAVSTAESQAFSVSAQGMATLNFGEPFTPSVFLPYGFNTQSNLNNIPLIFNIEGKGKEVIINMNRRQGAATKIPLSKKRGYENRPQEPTYTIIKPDGEIISQGAFEYG